MHRLERQILLTGYNVRDQKTAMQTNVLMQLGGSMSRELF